jgi:branched-subunit amino acid ABC-type transport system permease component
MTANRLSTPLTVLGAVAALVVGLDAAAPDGGLEISTSVVLIGLFLGLTYSLLAVGLVLVYRATGVINFAYGEIGALGAVLIAKMTYDGGVPFVVSLLVVVALGGLLAWCCWWRPSASPS